MKRTIAIAAGSALIASCAQQGAAPRTSAQVPVRAAEPTVLPSPVTVRPVGPCRQVRDGNVIVKVQEAANRLIASLEKDPTYGGARFEHYPCYRLVLAFTDDRLRRGVVDAAEPELRSYLAFTRTPLSHAGFERARQEIAAAVAATRVRALIFVSPYPPMIEVGVRTEADARIVHSVIPIRYRAITKVIPGGYSEPIPE
jgi:hypothetical protein